MSDIDIFRNLDDSVQEISKVSSHVLEIKTNGEDSNSIADALGSLNDNISITLPSADVLSVVLPPEISIGENSMNLKEIALVLKSHQIADAVGMSDVAAFCCGHAGNGCCINWR